MKENSLIIAFGSNETSLMKGEDDMYPKDFGKYISVSEESLHEAGFEKGSRHKGKAIYWVRKDVDYVLVKTRTKNTCYSLVYLNQNPQFFSKLNKVWDILI